MAERPIPYFVKAMVEIYKHINYSEVFILDGKLLSVENSETLNGCFVWTNF